MTKNGLDIQTISTKRTDNQTDRVLLFGQVTEKKEKANPSHFLKFLLASRTLAHLVLPQRRKPNLQQNQKSQFPAHPQKAVVVDKLIEGKIEYSFFNSIGSRINFTVVNLDNSKLLYVPKQKDITKGIYILKIKTASDNYNFKIQIN